MEEGEVVRVARPSSAAVFPVGRDRVMMPEAMVAAVAALVVVVVAAGAAMGTKLSGNFEMAPAVLSSMVHLRSTQELEEVEVSRPSSAAAFSVGRTQVVMSGPVASPALTLPPPTSSLHPCSSQIAPPRSTLRFAHLSCLALVPCWIFASWSLAACWSIAASLS
jgi:hypothetical protein